LESAVIAYFFGTWIGGGKLKTCGDVHYSKHLNKVPNKYTANVENITLMFSIVQITEFVFAQSP